MEQLKNALRDLPYQLGDVLVVDKKATFIKVTVSRIIIDNNGLSFEGSREGVRTKLKFTQSEVLGFYDDIILTLKHSHYESDN